MNPAGLVADHAGPTGDLSGLVGDRDRRRLRLDFAVGDNPVCDPGAGGDVRRADDVLYSWTLLNVSERSGPIGYNRVTPKNEFRIGNAVD